MAQAAEKLHAEPGLTDEENESSKIRGSVLDMRVGADAEQLEIVTGVRLVILIISLALGVFLVLLDASIVSTAVPKITDEFHSLKDVGWYASSYQLGSAVLQLLTGKIFDKFSLKWTFISFFTVFELGSALCGAAQSSAMLIVARTVAGIGAAGLINGGLTILSASVPIERRPPLTGLIMGIAQLGVILGPLIGGAFTTGYTWRWCFYINLPLGALVAIPLILLHIPEQIRKEPPLIVLRRIHHHLDLVGFAIFAPAVVMLLLALQFGGSQFPWHSSQIIGLFCGAGVTCIVWLVWNYYKGADAMLPLSIVRRRTVWMSGLNYTFLACSMLGVSYFLPIYFQAVKGVTAVISGVYLLATILPQLVAAVSSGVLVNKIGRIPPFAIAGSLLFSVSCGLYALFQPDTPTGQWVGFQILNGVGRGFAFQMPIIAVQHAVTPAELSSGMAFIVWCQYIGPAIFLTLLNTVFDNRLVANLETHAPSVNPEVVVAAGATGFRDVVQADAIPGILKAYSDSFDVVFYMAMAAGLICFITSFGLGWQDISPPTDKAKADGKETSPANSTLAPAADEKQSSEPEAVV